MSPHLVQATPPRGYHGALHALHAELAHAPNALGTRGRSPRRAGGRLALRASRVCGVSLQRGHSLTGTSSSATVITWQAAGTRGLNVAAQIAPFQRRLKTLWALLPLLPSGPGPSCHADSLSLLRRAAFFAVRSGLRLRRPLEGGERLGSAHVRTCATPCPSASGAGALHSAAPRHSGTGVATDGGQATRRAGCGVFHCRASTAEDRLAEHIAWDYVRHHHDGVIAGGDIKYQALVHTQGCASPRPGLCGALWLQAGFHAALQGERPGSQLGGATSPLQRTFHCRRRTR